MRYAVLVATLVGCRHPMHHDVSNRGGERADGPCDLVEAMLSIDDVTYQRIYRVARQPLVAKIEAPPDLFPPRTSCPGRRFSIFHGDPDLLGTIVVLDVGHSGQFMASLLQPNLTPTPGGGLESTEYYQHASRGHVELRGGRWRTWHD